MQYTANIKGNNTITNDLVKDTIEKSMGISSSFPLNMIQNTFQNQIFSQPSKKSHPKCKFTAEEDEMLKQLVNNYINSNDQTKNLQIDSEFLSDEKKNEIDNGDVSLISNFDWNEIAQQMKTGRNARQCRERWLNYLSPSVVNGPWTDEEEELLCNKYNEIGPHWKKIAFYFPTRTDINIKSHYHLLERRKRKEEKKKEKAIQKQKEIEEMNNRNQLINSIQNNINRDMNGFAQALSSVIPMTDLQKISTSPLPFIQYQNINRDIMFNTNCGVFYNMPQNKNIKKNQKSNSIKEQNLNHQKDLSKIVIDDFSEPNSPETSSFMSLAEKEFEQSANECWNSLLMNNESNEIDEFFDTWL